MLMIPLTKNYNQSFTTSINSHKLAITLRSFRKLIYASVDVDEVNAVNGFRIVQNAEILPWSFARKIGGNIMFLTNNGQYPYPEDFDNSVCKLVFKEFGE